MPVNDVLQRLAWIVLVLGAEGPSSDEFVMHGLAPVAVELDAGAAGGVVGEGHAFPFANAARKSRSSMTPTSPPRFGSQPHAWNAASSSGFVSSTVNDWHT